MKRDREVEEKRQVSRTVASLINSTNNAGQGEGNCEPSLGPSHQLDEEKLILVFISLVEIPQIINGIIEHGHA